MLPDLVDTNVAFAGDLARNIKTIRASQNLFDDLSGDPADWAAAISAEAEERIPTAASVITRPFDYGTVISYSFVPAHWQATRFGDGSRYGVWYGSTDALTTVYETVHHWHRFLTDSFAGEDREIVGERRVYDVRCEALLIDLRGKERRHPGLVDRASYAFTQRLGAFLHAQGSNGLLVRSALQGRQRRHPAARAPVRRAQPHAAHLPLQSCARRLHGGARARAGVAEGPAQCAALSAPAGPASNARIPLLSEENP